MKIDYKSQILDELSDYVSGLTIRDISIRIKVHRNTVSKYLNIMEVEGSVKKQKVGSALLYVNSKNQYIQKKVFTSFIKTLFNGLKDEFPNGENTLKNIGRNIAYEFEFPIKKAYLIETKMLDFNEQIKILQKYYNAFDLIQDDVDISIMELTKKQSILRIKNSKFLESSDDYLFFFSMVSGIAEGLFWKYFNRRISCDIFDSHISTNRDDSYIEIIIKNLNNSK